MFLLTITNRALFIMCSALCLLLAPTHFLKATWQPPVSISGPGASGNQIAVDSYGNAIAIWSSNLVIQAATLPYGTISWSAPINVSTSETAIAPQIAIDPKGNAVAVWKSSQGPNTHVVSSTLPFGGTWTTPINVSPLVSAFAQQAFPQVGVDGDGDAIAVWIDGNTSTAQAAVLLFGTNTWSTPVSISTDEAASIDLAVNNNGDAIAAWVINNGSNLIIQTSVLKNGSWSTPVNISDTGQDANTPQVSIDSSGNGFAIWSRSNGTNTIIQAALYAADTGLWTPAENLSLTGQNAVDPQITATPNGYAVAIWSRNNGTNFIIQASTHSPGENWTEIQNLSTSGSNASSPDVDVNPSGNAVAVWIKDSLVQSATLPFDRTWTTPVNISVATSTPVPKVAVAINGYTVADWIAFVDGELIVQAAIGVDILPPLSPLNFTGFVLKSKFLNKTAFFLKSKWDANPSATVVSYRIYKDAAVVQEIPANKPLVYETPIRSESDVNFEVASVNADNLESDHTKLEIVKKSCKQRK